MNDMFVNFLSLSQLGLSVAMYGIHINGMAYYINEYYEYKIAKQ